MRIDRTMIGFALINGFTFMVDLLILTATNKLLHWPLPVAATVGYAIALSLSFVLNRSFNFHVHGHFGTQAGQWAIAVAINYVVFILGFVSLLVGVGLHVAVARICAGVAEAVFLYSVMRFVVFRGPRKGGPSAGSDKVNAAGTSVNPVTTRAE